MAQTKFIVLSSAQLDQVYGGAGCAGNDSVDANVNANFVNQWHGLGCCHQADTEPGDTAQDRHYFDTLGATAGKSGVNPTYN